MNLKHLTVGTALYVALLATAPAAFAQTASQSGYSEPAGNVQQQITHHQPRADTRAASNDPGLPFTGLDLGLVGGAGGMLLAFGLGVRRLVGSQAS